MSEFNESHPMIEQAFEFFSEVCKLAVLQELKIRLLASKTQEISSNAFDFKVSYTLEAVIGHYKPLGMLNEDDCAHLRKSNEIRNKILHCEFDTAIQKIEALVGPLAGPGVVAIHIGENLTPEEMLKTIFGTHSAMARNDNSRFQTVDEMDPKDVGIFGTFLNAVQKGAFSAANDIFSKANETIDRIISETAKIDFEKGQKK